MKVNLMTVTLDVTELEPESAFWAALLSGEVEREERRHSILVDGVRRLDLRLVEHHEERSPHVESHRPIHLDLQVPDLQEAHDEVAALGGHLLQSAQDPSAREQHQVWADPAGHPFRLWMTLAED